MLRRHDRSAMHETGRVLAVRLAHEAGGAALDVAVLVHEALAVLVDEEIKEVLPGIVLRVHHQGEDLLRHDAACRG